MDKATMPTTTGPRRVIRGSDSQNDTKDVLPFGIHWIRGTIPIEMLGSVRGYFQMLFGDFESRKFGLWFYDRSDCWPNGASLQ